MFTGRGVYGRERGRVREEEGWGGEEGGQGFCVCWERRGGGWGEGRGREGGRKRLVVCFFVISFCDFCCVSLSVVLMFRVFVLVLMIIVSEMCVSVSGFSVNQGSGDVYAIFSAAYVSLEGDAHIPMAVIVCGG